MRIKSIHLTNFKRFTDLTIADIPASAKLVLVVGPNGCGKSSLFDALLHWYRLSAHGLISDDLAYFRKDVHKTFEWHREVDVQLHDDRAPHRDCLYIRTAHRNDPDFSISTLRPPADPSQDTTLYERKLIDDDKSVSANYQALVYRTTAEVYNDENDLKTVGALRDELIGGIRASMKNVFGDLTLNNITDPLGAGAFFFRKGTVASYHYKNLSGGEKAAFDLLLDLHIKKPLLPDAIYCIDEIDLHLHTDVQGRLLHEMLNVVPSESQLWVTTHSLGALRAAQTIEAESPGSVCILDFDGVDADEQTVLTPTALNRVAWEKMLSIMLGDLAPKVAPDVIVICEGSSSGNRRRDFDAKIYNRILGSHEPGFVFISGGSATEVENMGNDLSRILTAILPKTKVVPLVDRDDKSDEEVRGDEGAGLVVLSKRNLESYLFADDVLRALTEQVGQHDRYKDVLALRAEALAASVARGNRPDDLKSAAGEIYNGLKQMLSLEQPGNNKEAFMRDTLAPLIQPGMDTYKELHSCIVEGIERL